MAWVEVEVNMSDFSTDDLIDELEYRGDYIPFEDQLNDIKEIVERIYKKHNAGDPIDSELYALFYQSLGRIV